ncbi:MAG TPA: ferredoxin reductase [Trebonia sp.]|jgi:ferredoxin-NADP reductase|nr:ferredoxin reductase [Trebonia sp.]
MARAAVPGRLTWRVATVKQTKDETATARTLTLDVPGWPGHAPGQHVAVKLTAADGYTAQRDYSIGNASEPDRLEITVQRLSDGEVSPYLAEIAEPGDQFDLRGPIGGWFTWDPADPRPLLLFAGGSGIVPLMAMIRTHAQFGAQVPVRLIYSARTPADIIYQEELSERQRSSPLTITYLYTRSGWAARGIAPARDSKSYTTRLNAKILAETAFPPSANPATFVCGPSGFVEAASSLLVAAGHAPGAIKTERFGPGG